MKVFIILAVLVAAAVAQYAEPQYAPIPYSFNYVADTEDGGKSSRTETGDGAGRVEGSYTVDDLEGNSRVVEYIADEAGFRANIRTNEPGTASINPADVNIESSAGGPISYSLGGGAGPAVATRRVAPPPTGGRGGAGVRYVLVPSTDPRARGYQ